MQRAEKYIKLRLEMPRPTILCTCRAAMTENCFQILLLPEFQDIGSYPQLVPRLSDILRAYAHYH